MTLRGAIIQLEELRDNSMMPVIFKPYFDKVIETVSECKEPSAQPEIVRCKDCLMHGVCRFEQGLGLDGYCSQAERRTDGN